MKASTLLLFTLLLTACGVARPVLESDNTKVEVKVVEKIVKDTAWFEQIGRASCRERVSVAV